MNLALPVREASSTPRFMPLTTAQANLLKFLKDYRAGKNLAPTLDEAAKHAHTTRITVLGHLRCLEAKGYIRRERYRSRAITIIADACPHCGGTGFMASTAPS